MTFPLIDISVLLGQGQRQQGQQGQQGQGPRQPRAPRPQGQGQGEGQQGERQRSARPPREGGKTAMSFFSASKVCLLLS
jgi:hypothetical protein